MAGWLAGRLITARTDEARVNGFRRSGRFWCNTQKDTTVAAEMHSAAEPTCLHVSVKTTDSSLILTAFPEPHAFSPLTLSALLFFFSYTLVRPQIQMCISLSIMSIIFVYYFLK